MARPRIPHLLIALVFLALPLAGCFEGAVPDLSEEDPGPTPATSIPARVLRQDANGTTLPVEEVLDAIIFDTGATGGEPTMGITSDGTLFTIARDLTMRSRDAGATWDIAYDFSLKGSPVDPLFTADPMVHVDAVTDRVFTNHMFPVLLCSRIAWSDDNGDSWMDRDGACGAPPFDYQKLGSGVPGPKANPFVGAYPSVTYLCHNRNVFAVAPVYFLSSGCVVSYDGGLTWPVDRIAARHDVHGCGGVTSFPVVAPDGVAVLPFGNGCSTFHMAVSEDSGLSWNVVKVPGKTGMISTTPSVAFTPDGTLYAAWNGYDNLPYIARTRDLGKSWDGPWQVAPQGVTSAMFTTLRAGDDGRIAMAFHGSRDTAEYPANAPADSRWHLFAVASLDAGSDAPTFMSMQMTPDDDPVQVGPICHSGGCRNLLDFIGSAVAPDGAFHVAFADGCTDRCAGNASAKPDDSRDARVKVARLDGVRLTAG